MMLVGNICQGRIFLILQSQQTNSVLVAGQCCGCSGVFKKLYILFICKIKVGPHMHSYSLWFCRSRQFILQHKISFYNKTLQVVVSCIVYSTEIRVHKNRNLFLLSKQKYLSGVWSCCDHVLWEDVVHRIKGGAGQSESKLPLYNLTALGLNLPEGQRNAESPWLFSG